MKNLEKINEYLGSCAVMVAKIHNLHWNVEGCNFKIVHLATDDLYEEFFKYYDDLAERIRMQGERPLVKLEEYAKVSFIKELPSKAFSVKEVLEILISDLKVFKNKALDLRTVLDKEGDFVTVNILEDFISSFDKHIWFFESEIK